jgi:hypothetical protein
LRTVIEVAGITKKLLTFNALLHILASPETGARGGAQ